MIDRVRDRVLMQSHLEVTTPNKMVRKSDQKDRKVNRLELSCSARIKIAGMENNGVCLS